MSIGTQKEYQSAIVRANYLLDVQRKTPALSLEQVEEIHRLVSDIVEYENVYMASAQDDRLVS